MDKELDAIVAEKIMGWHWDDDWGCLIPLEQVAKPSEMYTEWQDGYDEEGPYLYREPANGTWISGIVYNGNSTKIILPNYSTDISDAWKVVEKMARPPQAVEEAVRARNVRFSLWFNTHDLWAMTAQEAAQAICEAALKIMEE